MKLDELIQQTVAYITISYPELEHSSPLVEECLDSALLSFTEDFICQFRPETWAKITIIYHKHFLETGVDVSVGEIFNIVIRDSIQINRMDFLTQGLAQQKAFDQKNGGSNLDLKKAPTLSIVKSSD